MKKSVFILAVMISVSAVFGQKSNLILFTEQGEKFSVILNGVLQNENPETNVKVTDLISPSYKLKIIFQDSSTGSLDKTIYFNTPGVEANYSIKKNNKGEYVVRYMNEVPIAQAPPPPAGQKVIIFTTIAPVPAITIISTTQTTTTTSGGNVPPPEGSANMGIHVNDPDLGVNMNINIGGANMTGSSSTTTYSTTTTTTSSGMGMQPAPVQQQQVYVMPGYSGPVGCQYPMSPSDFAAAKNTISSKSFEDSKLAIAKQVFASNCMLSSQVREIMMLFSFEDSKLEFAKYAYGYTYDLGNYFKVNDAFTFENSIDELNSYISGLGK
ncbi:MAG: DUF4476 domain-containing protein [Bacteroidales bacterium]